MPLIPPRSYTPRPDWLAHGHTCCGHCGQVPDQHHSDTRCYTDNELGARLAFSQRTGRWPGPDEGCTQQEEPPC